MLCRCLCAVLGLLVFVVVLMADQVKGKIKTVDGDKGNLVVTSGTTDHTFRVSMATKIVDVDGKEVIDGLKDKEFSQGAEVTVTFEKKGKKEQVTEVRLNKKVDNE